jgi:hypothetical protein
MGYPGAMVDGRRRAWLIGGRGMHVSASSAATLVPVVIWRRGAGFTGANPCLS